MKTAAEPSPEQHHTVSVAPPYSPRHLGKAPAGEAEAPGHGLECIVEILAQIVGLIASDAAAGGGPGGGSMDEFGLELMNAALSAGGTGVRRQERRASSSGKWRHHHNVGFASLVRVACSSKCARVATEATHVFSTSQRTRGGPLARRTAYGSRSFASHHRAARAR